MSQRVFDTWLAWGFDKYPSYAAQLTCYMTAGGKREAVYAVVNRGYDGEGLQLDIRVVPEPPIPFSTIENKVKLAEWYAERGELPVCDSASQYSCPYDYLCDRHEIIFEELEQGGEKLLRQLADQHEEIKRTETQLKERKSEVRLELETALAGRSKVKIPGYTFSMSTRKSRKLNQVRLREELGERIEEFYEESESAPFLTVRPVKRRQDDE
jgi:hypothetical protein